MIQIPNLLRAKLTKIIELPRRTLYYLDENIMQIADSYAGFGIEIQWIIPSRRFKLELIGGSIAFSGSPFYDKTLVAVVVSMPTDDSDNGSSPELG